MWTCVIFRAISPIFAASALWRNKKSVLNCLLPHMLNSSTEITLQKIKFVNTEKKLWFSRRNTNRSLCWSFWFTWSLNQGSNMNHLNPTLLLQVETFSEDLGERNQTYSFWKTSVRKGDLLVLWQLRSLKQSEIGCIGRNQSKKTEKTIK